MKLHIRAGNTINKHFRFYMATLFALYMCLMCACETVNININIYPDAKESDPVKYNALLESFKSFIRYLCNAGEEDDLSNPDIKTGTEEYLKKGGLDPAQIKEIEDYITVEK